MKLNIAIVDDREQDRERLRLDIKRWCCPAGVSLETIQSFPSGETLLKKFEPMAFQLVFMDIYMDQLNGIETAHQLRAMDACVLIVFLTTSRDFAFDAFPIHPFDYIVKPYDRARLDGILNEAVRVLMTEDPEIIIQVSRRQYHLPLRGIASAVSQKHSVEICLTNGSSLLSNMSLTELEALLADDPRFLVCNRGVIINMEQVASADNEVFRMKNGQVYPIRVRGRAKVLSDFSQYQMSRLREFVKPTEVK
ncbi:MAG: LytTR family DNA-binding domain-containing protein [Fretibacterium sp.]|nr:LytTR family DNA-binding domain-containing protein [Fretibacterium sp.]